MTKCVDKKNLLQHNGTNQMDRLLKQLLPEHILVNEKSLEQWATFTSVLSEKLKFYNTDNTYAGNWSQLFNTHPAINFARLATQDVDDIKTFFRHNYELLQARLIVPQTSPLVITQGDQDAQIANQCKAFSEIYEAVFTICVFIENQLTSTSSPVYRARLSDLVKNKLRIPLKKLLSIYKGGFTNFIVPSGNTTNVIWGQQLANLSQLTVSLKSPEWIDSDLGHASFADYYNSTDIPADISVFTSANSLIVNTNQLMYNALNRASRHNLFTLAVDAFTYASAYLRSYSENAFETEISQNGLTPHLALYFTFLHLLQDAQKDLNQFTQRHLDFFYRKVLRMEPLPIQPNYAHLCLEIGKQVPEYLLKAGTRFKAGKDDLGKDLYYSIAQDTIFNHIGISGIKSYYQAGVNDNSSVIINNSKAFASPVANSADGIGKEIKDEPASWHPFGNKMGKSNSNLTMLMPGAEVGFAFASPYLLLREGDRSITIKLYTPQAALLNKLPFRCEFTTAKGWEPIVGGVVAKRVLANDGFITFKITLPTTFAAIEGYQEAVHAASIDSTFPVARFILDDDNFTTNGLFEKVKATQFTKCRIEVEVGKWASNLAAVDTNTFTGLKNLYLSNQTGALDAKKPFHPFGKPAKAGTFLTIGNRELFLKPNAEFQVAIEHTELQKEKGNEVYLDYLSREWSASGFVNKEGFLKSLISALPQTDFHYLESGTWKDKHTSSQPIYDESAFTLLIDKGSIPAPAVVEFAQGDGAYNQSSFNGFLKINLLQDFGDEEYQNDLITYRIKQSQNETNIKKPVQPYAPCIKRICINYRASVELDFGKISDASKYLNYYYLYPFGAKRLTNVIAPQRALLQGPVFNLTKLSRFQPLIMAKGSKLIKIPIGKGEAIAPLKPIFPQFDGVNATNARVTFISELYIGLKNTRPLQNVNLLFQVLDGSTNPLTVKPDKHIYWYYLSDNEWKLFTNEKMKDNTSQLLHSGIITFQIQEDADSDNTLLPKGSVWIKAAIAEKPDAVSRLIDIKAQAALVQFADNNNSPTFLVNQIPALTINKLLEPASAIKKIVQPYPSFGGRNLESENDFRVRVSERIRHKDRAIQIYDYERLILQQFDTIQKVKCLNHTRYEPGLIYNEQAPGYVTIITIPYVSRTSTSDPLRPYTSTRDLLAIKEFIRTKVSPHVTVQVQNPVFEEIKMDFKLRFIAGIDKNYYTELLRNEITQFLTPWAYNDSAEISFGGRIHKSSIINFIEERNYVDVIADVKMYQRKNDDIQFSKDMDTVAGSTARSILVSASPEQHSIVLM